MAGRAEKCTTLVQSLPVSSTEEAELSFQFSKEEHSQGFWVALRRHWPAVAWGLFMNLVCQACLDLDPDLRLTSSSRRLFLKALMAASSKG